MSEQNTNPETTDVDAGETPEVEAHSAGVLGLQRLKDAARYSEIQPDAAFSCSSCAAMSC